MNEQLNMFKDLSCASENRIVYRDQDYVKLVEENNELKKQNKELREKIKLFNALSRQKKKKNV